MERSEREIHDMKMLNMDQKTLAGYRVKMKRRLRLKFIYFDNDIETAKIRKTFKNLR